MFDFGCYNNIIGLESNRKAKQAVIAREGRGAKEGEREGKTLDRGHGSRQASVVSPMHSRGNWQAITDVLFHKDANNWQSQHK